MPISPLRRQAEILLHCAEASYWMAARSSEDERALRIREAALLLEEVASAMRAGDRGSSPPGAPATLGSMPARSMPKRPLAAVQHRQLSAV